MTVHRRNVHERTSTIRLFFCPSSELWRQLRSLLCAFDHVLKTNKKTAPVDKFILCPFLSGSVRSILSRLLVLKKCYVNRPDRLQRGVTLIELLFSIVIISISFTGILKVVSLTTEHSSDPLIEHQAVAIAESYLEEILLQAYEDRDGTDGETNRTLFDDVDDYHGLSDSGVKNQYGVSVASLANYDVNVTVTIVTLASSIPAKRVQVNVSNAGQSISLVGFRTDVGP